MRLEGYIMHLSVNPERGAGGGGEGGQGKGIILIDRQEIFISHTF